MGFEKEHIALVVKVPLWASISAGLVGGVIMLRLGINRALWVFGFIQLITIGGFIWLAAFGHFDHIGAAELWKLGFVIAGEYIGVGPGTRCLCRLYGSRNESALYSHSVSFIYQPFCFTK